MTKIKNYRYLETYRQKIHYWTVYIFDAIFKSIFKIIYDNNNIFVKFIYIIF